MDPKDRLFADIAVRLQLLTSEQVTACGEQRPGKRLPEAAVELGWISSDEAALVQVQAERAFGRQQQPRTAGGAVRVAEESVSRIDPRAEAAPRRAGGPPPHPPAPEAVSSAKPRKRGARSTWESPDAVEQRQIHVPRAAAGQDEPAPAPSARTRPMLEAIHIADTEKVAPANDVDGFPLAQGDEVAHVVLSEPPSAPAPVAAPVPAPAGAVAVASNVSPARAPVVAAIAPEPIAEVAHEPVRAAIPTPPPPRAAAVRPAAVLAPQDCYLGKALAVALKQRASDLHVHSGAPLLCRVDGELRPLGNSSPITAQAAEKIIAEIATDAQWAQLGKKGEVDFACAIRGLGRFRANVYRQQRGLDAVFRIIPEQPPSLEELGLPARLARLTDFRTGMVLCTGPTGSGKSTTLAALLNGLVQTRSDHILTIEDPVEYVFGGGRALVNQRQVGDHTDSFARALRAALREDPDIIAITELRDRETISLAISAAETGHLVLGTLHTGNAAQTIHRIVSSFGAEEQEQVRVMLAESLRAVVSQRLVPMAVGRGRVPAIELLMVTTAVSNLIREDKTYQLPSVMQTGKAAGMVTLDDSLDELVAAGTITAEAARRVAVKKERFA